MIEREKNFRNKVQRMLEQAGGMVFRINDVPGTGLRYADLIWIHNGHVLGIECKLCRGVDSSTVHNIPQKRYATIGQCLANHLFQRAGALYIYCFWFQDGNILCAFYQSYKRYNPAVEGASLPTVVLSLDELIRFVQKSCSGASILEQFANYYVEGYRYEE